MYFQCIWGRSGSVCYKPIITWNIIFMRKCSVSFKLPSLPKTLAVKEALYWTITGENKAKGIQVGAESSKTAKEEISRLC